MKASCVLTLAVFLLSGSAFGQTQYVSPDGRFSVQVPAGWHAQQGVTPAEATIRNGAVSANITVLPQDPKNRVTVNQAMELDQGDLQNQCPTYQVRKKGPALLAGAEGEYVMSTCSDPKSPAVAECSAAMTEDDVLVLFYVISPLSRFYESIPTLDFIRDSLRVVGGNRGTPAAVKSKLAPANSNTEQMQGLKRACAAGVFAGDECGRRMGMLLGKQAPAQNRGSPTDEGNIYRDPQNRFTVMVPEGWTAKAEGDNGSSGVQLRNGASFINLIPDDKANSASEVVLQLENRMALYNHWNKKPPFGPLGIIQLFGNGVEVAYDEFEGSSAAGQAVEAFLAGVGDIKGGGPFLSVTASIQKGQTAVPDGIGFKVAQNVHLPRRE